MKKQKMLAWVLAVSMASTSISSIYAQDVVLPDAASLDGTASQVEQIENQNNDVVSENETSQSPENEEAEAVKTDDAIEAVVSDETSSGSAVELADGETRGIEHKVTEPWKGSVFGDVGGADSISSDNFNIAETGKGSVNMRAGIYDVASNKAIKSVGKIAGSSDGLAMYFQQLKADQNFTLSATAEVVSYDSNNQVSFGLMARDDMYYDEANKVNTDYVAAGLLKIKNASTGTMFKSYYRKDGALPAAETDPSVVAAKDAPAFGQKVKITLSKAGNTYTCKFGDEEEVSFNMNLSDDIYVGPYVSRCAEVNFSDVSLVIEGNIEAGEWSSGWTGASTSNYSVTSSGDTADLKITKGGTGKISDGEDSFAYYAAEIPSAANFSISAKLTVNNFNTLSGDSNPNQAGFGVMIADKLHSKAESGETFANNVMLQSYLASKTAGEASFQASVRNGSKREYLNEFGTKFSAKGSNLGTYDLKISKSGNGYTFKCGDETYSYAADSSLFSGNIYPGFFVARNADISLSDIKIEVDNRVVTNLNVTKQPSKTEYVTGEELDLSGMEVVATYDDGSSEVVTDYVATGFDTEKVGTQSIIIGKGSATTTINIDVRALKLTDLVCTSKPVKNEYFPGTKFIKSGLSVKATYENGTEAVLEDDEYELSIDGKVINSDFYFDSSMVGNKQITVSPIAESDLIDTNNVKTSFDVLIKNGTMTGLGVSYKPAKTEYYLNDELVVSGMVIEAYFNINGTTKYDVLREDEYTVTGFDSSKEGNFELLITSNYNPNMKTTVPYTVSRRKAIELVISSYPKLTYEVGKEFDSSGLVVQTYYNNDEKEVTEDYTIDLKEYDSSKVGRTKVTIVPNNSNFASIELPITIVEPSTHYWKSLIFGQSSGDSSVTIDGDEVGIMKDGKLTNVNSVNVKSWDQAGKITGDHDGIGYYYTRVNANNNFTITADITVKQYMQDNDDTKRSGQEAFGIMARDVIPLESKDGGGITTNVDEAVIDQYGEPVGLRTGSVFASNMAFAGGFGYNTYPNDSTAANYEKYTNINRMNLYARTGVTAIDGGGVKNGPFNTSDHVPKVGDKYRVTFTKINEGIRMACTELEGEAKGTTKTYNYFFDGDTELANTFLKVQDENNIYVGFFAARWAEIDVENISLYETDPETDPSLYDAPEETYTPNLSLLSNDYTNETNYNLMLKSSNPAGGIVTIKLGDTVVYNNQVVTKRSTSFPITLQPDQINKVTVLYTPSKADILTSYEDLVLTYDITHRSNFNSGDVIYVSPNGKVNAAGTRQDPYDFDTALGFIKEGQKMILLEGVYKRDKGTEILLTNSGVASAMKYMWADDGAEVIFDMQGKYEGFTFTGSYWHVKGIDFRNSGANLKTFNLGGSNCIIEDCKFYNNGDTGMQVSRTYDTDDFNEWPSNNLILNCESYNNCDPSKNNADGFGCKLTVGNGNVFRGCVSHHNLDDGWDFYTKLASGPIGETLLENCVSYKQGYKINDDGTEGNWNGQTGHNGFKLGGENIPVKHYLKDSYAFKNQLNGVSTNSNPALKIRNVISYDNEKANFALYSDKPERYDYDIRGAISYKNSKNDEIGTLTKDANYTNKGGADAVYNDTNYFILENSKGKSVNKSGEVVDDSFFKSLDYDAIVTNCRLSQDADGKFILGNFLARSDEHSYTHLPEDIVTESTTEQTTEFVTEATTEKVTSGGNEEEVETTTKRTSSGGGSSSSKGSSQKTTPDKPKSDTTAKNDTTNNDKTKTDSNTTTSTGAKFVTKSGLTIKPPVASKSASTSNRFPDTEQRPWAVPAINKLAAAGIISGIGNGEFNPDQNSKRGDFVTMLVRALGIDGEVSDNFNDVSSDKYYANAIGLAKQIGITSGDGNNEFNPESTITRQDTMVLIAKTLDAIDADIDIDSNDTSVLDKYDDSNDIADYAKPYVAALVNKGIINGTGSNIDPNSLVTRAQMSVMIANVYDLVVDMAEEAQAEAEADEEE